MRSSATEPYEVARRRAVWQAIKPARFPADIIDVASVDDAIAGIALARGGGRQVAVISSGHSYIGNGVQDGVVLLDATGRRRIEIDSDNAVARVQAGASNTDVDAALSRHGFAFPVGHSPSVALGGYLLGGGLGWNSEAWGKAACMNVVGAEVLLASGELVTASTEEHPDLFWALRGSGPGFCGLVTEFSLSLRTRPECILEMACSFGLDLIEYVAEWVEQTLPAKPDRVELSTLLARSPTDHRDGCQVTAVAFGSDEQDAHQLLAPLEHSLRRVDPAATVTFAHQSIGQLMAQNDAPALRYCVETAWMADIRAALVTASSSFRRRASAESLIHVSFRTTPSLPTDLACAVADTVLVFSSAIWSNPAHDEVNQQWSDDLVDTLSPKTTGRYINECDYFRHPDRLNDCLTPAARERLKKVRSRYDPDGVFYTPNGL